MREQSAGPRGLAGYHKDNLIMPARKKAVASGASYEYAKTLKLKPTKKKR